MEQYRTRGVTVEAVQLTAENVQEVADWCGGFIVKEQDSVDRTKFYAGINVPLPHGRERLSEGQFLVKNGDAFEIWGETVFTARFERFEFDFNEVAYKRDPEVERISLLSEMSRSFVEVLSPEELRQKFKTD